MSETIGAVLKRLREERKLSKARLARESGISDAYLVQIEKGDRHPSDAVTRQMAKALRVPPHQLLIPAGYYSDAQVAAATERAEEYVKRYESQKGEALTPEMRERVMDRALDDIDYDENVKAHFESGERDLDAEEREFARESDPFQLSDDEYWDWDKATAWAPEGWNDLSSRDRRLVQELITRLVQLQPQG